MPRQRQPVEVPVTRAPTGPARSTVVLVVAAVIVAATAGVLGLRSWADPSTAVPDRAATSPATSGAGPGDRRGGSGRADGAVPAGVTVFDDRIPAVGNLDPDLLESLRRAATAAARDGVTFVVNSGWRSPEYQTRLLREAISTYGSEVEAARWVATADTSRHVSGEAVDIGHSDATAWLSRHGSRYGLCQIYRNEPWHVELRPDAVDDGCPPPYTDPTHDPRMQQ